MINRRPDKRVFFTKTKLIVFNIFFALLVVSLCFLILQPFLNKVSLSFMSQKDLVDSTVVNIPKNPTLDNYKFVWSLLDFSKSLPYTAILSLVMGLLQTASSLLVGYGFARYDFPLKKFWFICVIIMIIIPTQAYSISLYLDFRFFDIFGIFQAITGKSLNLIGTPVPLLLMAVTATGLKNGLYIYLFYQYFRGIPRDLEEAAHLDGCGTLKTLFRVMIPDAAPLITSCMLFAFVWQWTDYQFTNLLLASDNFLATRLNGIDSLISASGGASLANSSGTMVIYSDTLTATATLLMLVPVVTLYVIGQKKFVESLNFSGVKM